LSFINHQLYAVSHRRARSAAPPILVAAQVPRYGADGNGKRGRKIWLKNGKIRLTNIENRWEKLRKSWKMMNLT